MKITLRQLTYFMALAEEGHFGRAAAHVHVTQPALSMQIRELEEILGVTLFERGPREVRLTRAGAEMQRRARHIVDEAAALEQSVRYQSVQGRLNIGIIPTLAPYILPIMLPVLRERQADRDIYVREALTHALYDGLEQGGLDAIIIAGAENRRNLVYRSLFRDHFLLACHKTRLPQFHHDQGVDPAMLNAGQLLLLEEGHCLTGQTLAACHIRDNAPGLHFSATSLGTLCGFVGQDMGITFLPETAQAYEQAAVPDMALCRFAAPWPFRQIILACRAHDGVGPWLDDLAEAAIMAGERLVLAARQKI